LGVQSFEEARRLDSSAIMRAAYYQVWNAAYANHEFGPRIDSDLVPDFPGTLLSDGKHARNLDIMVGHTDTEGVAIMPMRHHGNGAIELFLYQTLDTIAPLEELYPSGYDGLDDTDRDSLIAAEVYTLCNTNYINKAFGNRTYAFELSDGLGIRLYSNTSRASQNQDAGSMFERCLISFAATGDPSAGVDLLFPPQGNNAIMVRFGTIWESMDILTDPTSNERCKFWQLQAGSKVARPEDGN
jgi:hypothetical protein